MTTLKSELLQDNQPPPPTTVHDSIAIVGIGCALPGGVDSPQSFWQLLSSGIDAIGEVPAERWNQQRYYARGGSKPGKTQCKWGGFVEGLDRFDPQFFGVSPKEAAAIDPQQRMLLQVAYRAIEDAGQTIAGLSRQPVGVYVGISSFDYAVSALSSQDHGLIGPYTNTGSSNSIAANRISYCFDLCGPSLAVDTACSSSLVALHLACESLRRGESRLALCGGVNALLLPDFYIGFSQLGVLSADGRCRAFDARANGYVRSEGAGMVLLKPLSQALADRDRIYSIIRATASNQDGHSIGLTVPNEQAQRALVVEACQRAGVRPADLQYVEAHGTGTPVGDPIEARALGGVLRVDRPDHSPCLIGSVKTNVGHLEAGAGVTGLIKVALSLHHQQIPAHLHLQKPNPQIDFPGLGLRVPTQTEPWPSVNGERLAGINSFGYGGTNAHAILQSAPADANASVDHAASDRDPIAAAGPWIIPLSAASPEGLRSVAEQWVSWLPNQPESAAPAIAATAALRRSHFRYRAAVVADSLRASLPRLQAIASDDGSRFAEKRTQSVLFVCCGQGAQYCGMARGLLQDNLVFADCLRRCDREFSKYVYWSLLEELDAPEAESRLNQTAIVQPALFAIQIALAAAWADLGILPAAVVGHSVGEIAAAFIAGALTFQDACRVAIERGRTMDQASSAGAMLAAGLSVQDALRWIGESEGGLSLAAVNGPTSVTVSGDKAAIQVFADRLSREGVFHKRLTIEYAFHSEQMEPVREPLLRALRQIQPRATQLPFFSTVTGKAIAGEQLGAEYWWHNVRGTVQFASAIQSATAVDFDTVVEMGPHPVLSYAINESLAVADRDVPSVPSLNRKQPDAECFAQATATMYTRGYDIDWSKRYELPAASAVDLPRYPFQNGSLWSESPQIRWARTQPMHPVLGVRQDQPQPAWQVRLDLNVQDYLADHQVRGAVILPAAAVIEAARAAAEQVSAVAAVRLKNLRFDNPCYLDDSSSVTLCTAIETRQRELTMRFRHQGSDDWQQLATMTVGTATQATAALTDSITTVKARCPQQVDSLRCYRFFAHLGLPYGERFRGLQRAWRRPGEAWAEVAEVAWEDPYHDPQSYHPALLDSCFHAMIVADGDFDHHVGDLHLPAEVGEVVFHRSLQGPARVHCVLREKSDSRTIADLDIYDANDQRCLSIRGFCSRRAGRTGERESTADHIYRYGWLEASRQRSGDQPVSVPAPLWCLFVPGGNQHRVFFQRVVQRIRRRGEPLVVVEAGENYRVGVDDSIRLDPQSADDFSRLLDDLQARHAGGADESIHFVYGWNWDVVSGERLDLQTLDSGIPLTTIAPLLLTQAWESRAEKPRRSRLTFLTRNAQSTDRVAQPICVPQGALIGLARVVISECQSITTRLIDWSWSLGAPRTTDLTETALLDIEVSDLLGELSDGDSREDEIMYRARRRFVRRFVRYFDQPLPAPQRRPVSRLQRGHNFGIGELKYRSCSRPNVLPHQVEIEVQAAGLNFSDVMKALNLYPGLSDGEVLLGAECCGRISRVGAEVTQWRVGQDVIAIAPGSFATHVVADANLVADQPRGLSPTEAAALPIAFLTARYALQDCARLSAGESILIHAASGGVGLAALQIARRIGAKIFATAGNEEKRDFVRHLGVERVMDSRSLDFADQIRVATAGQGVDVVLNSLPGEALLRSLETLKTGGRFLEIGKRDIYDNTPIGLFPFRNNLTFHAIDLDQLFQRSASLMGTGLRELATQFAKRELRPLPVKAWPADQSDEAFRFMQQAKHIGKVVVDYRESSPVVYPGDHPRLQFRPTATYWIAGGLGGFGLEIASWMANLGARTIVLSGRSAEPSPEAEATINGLRQRGVDVRVIRCDITKRRDVDQVLRRIKQQLPPLCGVLHTAMVLEDRLLADLDLETLQRVLRPKVWGGWNLHAATESLKLDYFILFSSLTSIFGHAGQANYSAANAFLDSLAVYRRSQGLPATVINWGHLGQVGYLARRQALSQRLERQGVLAFSVDQATAALDHLLQADAVQASVLRMDWSLWRGLGVTGEPSPRFADLVQESGEENESPLSLAQIRGEPVPRQLQWIDQQVLQKLSNLLGMPEAQIDRQRSLLELGLDSLMAVELRNWLDHRLSVEVPVSLLLQPRSLELAVEEFGQRFLTAKAESTGGLSQAPTATESDEQSLPLSVGHQAIDSQTAQRLLDEMPDMEPGQITELLAQLLTDQQERAADEPH